MIWVYPYFGKPPFWGHHKKFIPGPSQFRQVAGLRWEAGGLLSLALGTYTHQAFKHQRWQRMKKNARNWIFSDFEPSKSWSFRVSWSFRLVLVELSIVFPCYSSWFPLKSSQAPNLAMASVGQARPAPVKAVGHGALPGTWPRNPSWNRGDPWGPITCLSNYVWLYDILHTCIYILYIIYIYI